MPVKLFRVKRNWKRDREIMATIREPDPEEAAIIMDGVDGCDQVIGAGYNPDEIWIETPLQDLEERLVENALARIQDNPEAWRKAVRWTWRQASINAEMRKLLHDEIHKIVRAALTQTTEELRKISNYLE